MAQKRLIGTDVNQVPTNGMLGTLAFQDASKTKVTGTLEVPAGTASAPSLYFTGDPNTGLYSPGADQVAITTGGTGRLFVDASGNVNIGTSSSFGWGERVNCAGRLVVSDGTQAVGLASGAVFISGSTNNFQNGYYLNVDTSNNLRFYSRIANTDSERARIDSSGKVGIGTNSPDALLTVNGVGAFGAGSASAPSIAATGDLNTGMYFPGADQVALTTGGTGRLFVDASGNVSIATATADAKFRVFGNAKIGEGVASPSGKLVVNTVSGQAASLQLFQDENESWIMQNPASSTALTFANSGTERLRITSDGKVGIGTSSPGANLDVTGTSGTYPTQQIKHSALDTEGEFLRVARTDTGLRYHSIVARHSTSTSSGNNYIQFKIHDPAVNSTAQSTVLHIDGTGRVGIGATSPGSTLEINAAASTAPFIAKINTSEVARIDSSGRLLVGTASATANGGVLQVSNGITFPATQSACSDANTLDDYEEGTFTPTIIGTTTAGTGTYSVQLGRYVKIGKQVTVWIRVTWSAHTGTGNGVISGLPFTSQLIGGGHHLSAATIGYETNYDVAANTVLSAYVEPNGTNIFLAQIGVGTQSGSASAVLDTAAGITLSSTYETA